MKENFLMAKNMVKEKKLIPAMILRRQEFLIHFLKLLKIQKKSVLSFWKDVLKMIKKMDTIYKKKFQIKRVPKTMFSMRMMNLYVNQIDSYFVYKIML